MHLVTLDVLFAGVCAHEVWYFWGFWVEGAAAHAEVAVKEQLLRLDA